ncbi:MAG: hypothetical protein GW772_03415 [Flavobacteriia bacterium]|nr:hypothetical protein [Flavobacteriia bacterium]OIP46693.1 MAG: hypothetical protein AUK46_07630 [Flavobacteriaceae bacterium CG2_30_31_66]PIV97906.1 MAG: hypothetical protein COW43_00415 [Flavobacteriaceae bacterium CG17_big_fil_post_rev_8_21_14_2_50_31_13]PIX11681.1 MAG: hypothetical protein COZ74_13240 [Flavobacteriaceae bacterium CG_4_8_14_3_um_filter_31_8]PIY16181.1 MAG: hypothetical protein COZ16_01095 [Flavobacteriaceae bacterium CG_4_10_14_3_um_filter_31_253]PIZ11266.1 MAG: hypotheti
MDYNFNEVENINLYGTKIKVSSREQLSETINSLKMKKRTDLEKYFEKFYEKGYTSERIIINASNSKLLQKIYSKKKNYFNTRKSISDSLKIADAVFGAFINEEGQIIVNDSLFKYTNRGLYFGKLSDSLKIREVAFRKNSSAKSQKTIESDCYIRETEGGITEIENGVHQFVRIADETGCTGSGTGGGSTYNSNNGYKAITDIYNAKNSELGLNTLIQDLRIETSPDDNWFQNIWGTYRYSHEYFSDDDYRFELDFWDQTWLIYRSVGIEAETHKDGWFWWNNINSDEIVLGINKVHLIYDIPSPDISFFVNYTNNVLNQNTKQPLYIHNNSFFIKNNNSVYEPINIKVLNNNRIPFFEFRDDAILNIYIGSVLGLNLNLDITYNVLSDSNIKTLYKLGADYLKSKYSSRKDFIVTIQKNPNEVDLLYFDEFQRVYNTDEVERIFFSEWDWQIGLKFADTGSAWKSTYTPINLNGFNTLGDYKSKNIDIYGLARRGEEWRGLRLKF